MPTIYVPDIVVKELKNIMVDYNIETPAEGFRKMIKYSQAGRIVEQKLNNKQYDLSTIVPEIPIGNIKPKRQSIQDILGIS